MCIRDSYRETNLKDIALKLSEIVESAKIHTMNETDDWFDKVSVKRNMKELGGLATQFVKAAKERIKLDLPFTPGMKVAYVVTNTSGSSQEVEPWLVEDGGEPVSNYDPEYYSKRLAKALGRITEAFGWSENELLTGTRQTTLFSF